MKQRIITALIGLCVFFPVLFLSDTAVLPIIMSVISMIGSFELLRCIGYHKDLAVAIPTVLITGSVPAAIRYLFAWLGRISYALAIITVAMFIFMFYLMVLTVWSKGKRQIQDIGLLFMLSEYIAAGFGGLVLIRDLPQGFNLYFLTYVAAWIPDIFAYFSGRLFGKHKLIPDVSPKKTVEGAIGGFLGGGLAFVIFGWVLSLLTNAVPRYFALFAAGIVLAVISMFGDLIASLVKRHYNIKDYGNIFPGHGGVLDRFDSVLAVTPFLLMISAYPDIFYIFK